MPIPANYTTDQTSISSSTLSSSAPEYGKFYYAEKNYDQDFIKSVNRELLIKICNQRLYYYAIDDEKTTNNIYGESESKIFKSPTLVWARVNYIEPTQTLGQFGFDIKRQVEVYFYPLLLDEINLIIRQGDVIRLPGINSEKNTIWYEIASVVNQQALFGQFDNLMCIKCNANIARNSLINMISRIDANEINKP